MTIWERILAALWPRRTTVRSVTHVDGRVVFHVLKEARTIPNGPEGWGPPAQAACGKCGGVVRRVVFTTAGSGDQVAVWRQYPLAVDGWVCTECGWAAVPRRMSVEEVTEALNTGLEHAKAGRLDDAEFWFRRGACSWPTYPGALINLAQVLGARADAPSQPVQTKRTLRETAKAYLRRALEQEAQGSEPAVLLLAGMEALTGQEPEALARIRALEANPAVPEEIRSDARGLRERIELGKALFTQGAELAHGRILLHGEAPKVLSQEDRADLVSAAGFLEAARLRDPRGFPALWMLGKVRQRLGDTPGARDAFRAAIDIDPSQVDGCREYVAACLETGDTAAALPIAQRGCDLAPLDGGLRSNLALTQLLAGQLKEASATVRGALELDPADRITRALAEVISEVEAGRRAMPKTLGDLQRRN